MNIHRMGGPLRAVLVGLLLVSSAAMASNVVVNSLADDVFPNAAGAIFDINDTPVVLGTPKCTLRMAIAATNLNIVIGGANGCTAGSAAGTDTITFNAALNLSTTPGTIFLADKGMSEAPAAYAPPLVIQPALVVSGSLTITGPGSAFLTIDGGLPGNSGRRLLLISDGSGTVDSPFALAGMRLLRGRAIDQSSGCMFVSETVTITDMIFESCESIGGPTQAGFGGALGAGNTTTAGNYRPNFTMTNTLILSNRSTRGTSTTALPQVGGVFIGSGSRQVGAVNISGSRFIGNTAESMGAMYVRDANSVVLTNTQFLSNAATGTAAFLNGGRIGGFRIENVSGNVTLTDVGTLGNTANQERGGFSIITVGGTTTITDGLVAGNIALNGRIGGFEVLTDNFDVNGNCLANQRSPVIMNGLSVESNRASTNTGGFRVTCSGTVQLSNMEIKGNEVFGSQVAGSGGASAGAVNTNLAVTMADMRIVDNKTYSGAVDGGFAVFNVVDNTQFDGTRLLVRNNYAQQNEAGLSLRANGAGRNYSVTNSAFIDNSAGGGISALFLDRTGNYSVRNSTFSGNGSSTGGPIFVNMNSASGANAILFENVTSARNGTANLALEVGAFGVPLTPSGTVTIRNTLLGSGTSGIAVATANLQPVAGVNYVVSNTLIENNGFGIPAGICGVNGNLCSVDARLEAVADNGGFPGLT
ncbi:MAG: hypothetical protein ABI831_18055, partial [Betaproteobacteria bacterium]